MAITRGTLAKEVNGTVEYIYPRTASDMVIHRNTTVGDRIDSLEENKVDKVDGKSLSTNDFTDSYRDKLDRITDSDIGIIIDKELSSSSNNAIANSTVTERLNNITQKVDDIYTNGIGSQTDTSAVSQEQQQAINTAKADAVAQSKTYIDQRITNLIGGAPAALDTLMEIADVLKESKDAETTIINQLATKANKSDFNEHINNSSIHVTSDDKDRWNSMSDYSHNHSNKSILDRTTASFTSELEAKINSISDDGSSTQSDWSETNSSSPSFIKNKPSLGTASRFNFTCADTNVRTIRDKIPMFDGNGVLHTDYIKSGTQDNENPSNATQIIVSASDGIYRKASLEYVKTLLLTGENGGSAYALADHTHKYAGSDTPGGSANSAEKLNTSAGSTNKPVYFKNGKPVPINYSINKDVPADAELTDSYVNDFRALTVSDGIGLRVSDTNDHSATMVIKPGSSMAVRADADGSLVMDCIINTSLIANADVLQGTTKVTAGGTGVTSLAAGEVVVGNGTDAVLTRAIDTTNGGTSSSNKLITSGAVFAGLATKLDSATKYALSSSIGGVATCAAKLTTNAGSGTQPIYFSNGVPTNTTYTLSKSVPSNAVFTDTTYTFATGGTDGTIKVTPSNGTASNVSVKGLASAAYKASTEFATSGHTHSNYSTTDHSHAIAGYTAGFMSSADKAKLDSIADFAEVNTVTSVFGRTGDVTLTKSDVTGALGYTPPTSDTNTTYSFATGGTNGTIKVTPSGGSATNVSVKGLGTAAYQASTAFASSSHSHSGYASNTHTHNVISSTNTLGQARIYTYADSSEVKAVIHVDDVNGTTAGSDVVITNIRIDVPQYLYASRIYEDDTLLANKYMAKQTSVGSASSPVYLDSDGTFQVCTSISSSSGGGSDSGITYSFASGDSNGQIKVTPSSGSAYNVSVKGLGTAAYQASTAFATSSHTHSGYLTSQNTAYLYAGTSSGTTNSATTNGNTYLILKDGSTYTRRKINGTGAAQVTSDSSGNITVRTTKWVHRYNELLNSYESLFSKIYAALNNVNEADYIWNALIPAISSTYLLNTNALLYDGTFSSYIVPKSYSGTVTINPSTAYTGFAFTTSLSYSQRGWMFFIKENDAFDSCTNLYLSTDGETASIVHNSNSNLLRLKVNDVNESALSQTVTLDYLSGSPTVQAMQKVRTIGDTTYIVCFLIFSSMVHINNIYWRIVDDYGNNDFDDLTSRYRNSILASRIYGLGISTE